MSQYHIHLFNFFAGRGCAAAVVRVWLSPEFDVPPLEHCGEKTATDHWQYVSQGQTTRISFTSADKAIGAQVSLKEENIVQQILSFNLFQMI